MRKGDKKSVTIEFGTDKASLEAALRDIAKLTAAIQGLQGGRGIPTNQAPMPGAINAPSPPVSFGPGGTFQGMPASGLSFGGGNGSFGSSMPTMISYVPSITIQNAQNVVVTGQNITMNGGGSVDGTGGGGGVPIVSTPAAPGGYRSGQTAYGTIMQMMGGGGGLAQAVAMLAQGAGFIAPAAIPLALMHSFSQGMGAIQQGQFATQGYGAQLGVGQSQGQYFGQADIMRRKVMEKNAATDAMIAFAGPLYNIADFVSGGHLGRTIQEAKRTGDLGAQVVEQKELQNFLKGLGYEPDFEIGIPKNNSKDLAKALENLGQNVTQPFAMDGYMGFANDPAIKALFNNKQSKFTKQAIAAGLSSALQRLSPMGKFSAFASGEGNEDFAASGVISQILSGDLSVNVQKAFDQLRKAGHLDYVMSGGIPIDNPRFSDIAMRAATINQGLGMGQAGMSMAGSAMSYAEATGAGKEVRLDIMGAQGKNLAMMISHLQNKAAMLSGPGSEMERIQTYAQISQLSSEMAANEKRKAAFGYDWDVQLSSQKANRWGIEGQISAYQGTSARDNQAYSTSIAHTQSSLATLKAKKADKNFWSRASDIEKAELETQIAEAQVSILNQQRAIASAIYGEDSSFVGLRRSERQTDVMRAGLFGSSSQQFSAAQGQLSSIDEQIAAEKEYLNSIHTLTEKNQILANIRNLQNQRESENEMSYRQLYQGDMSMSQARSGAYGAIGSRQSLFGGSIASVGSSLSMTAEAGVRTARAKQEYERLAAIDPNGNATQLAYTEWQRAAAEKDLSYASTSFSASPGLRRESMNLEVQMAINSRTFAGYGDVRGSYEAGLKNVGKQLGELSNQREKVANKMRADGYSADQVNAAMEGIDRQAAGLTMQAVGYQQSLESGWMERLISEHYNAGGNYDLIASSFTKRNSVLFGGVKNRYFGATGQQASEFRRQGQMLMNSYSGIMNRPEGFLDSAVSGGGPGDGSINLGGVIKLEITLKDQSGKKLVDTQEHVNINNQTFEVSYKKNKGIMTG